MQYTLILKDGKSITLRFSMYFLNRACELTGADLNTIYSILLGEFDPTGNGAIYGGMLADLKIRSVVVAAGLEAECFAKGDFSPKNPLSFEVWEIIENVEGGPLANPWVEINAKLFESLTASLPKEPTEVKKKEASVSKSRSTTSKTRASGK